MKKNKVISAPFRWAGSKRKILNELIYTFPENDVYIEPFLGSGIVLINVLSYLNYKKIYVNDANSNIINFYLDLQKKKVELLNEINKIINDYNCSFEKEDYYYKSREKFNNIGVSIVKSALFWFLMKTGYNGVYRVNKSGYFNVPFGKKDFINFDRLEMENLSLLLKKVKFFNLDYKEFISRVLKYKAIKGKSIYIYLDPPYVGKSNGEIYSKISFNHQEMIDYLNVQQNILYAISMEYNEDDSIFDELESNDLKEVIRIINPQKMLKKKEMLYTNYLLK